MKKSDMIELIELEMAGYHPMNSNDFTSVAKNILEALEKQGMVPVTERRVRSGTAVVNKWEEDVTEKDWDRAIDSLGRD